MPKKLKSAAPEKFDFSEGKRGAVLPHRGKTRVTIYLDDAVLAAFRDAAESEGRGYQTAINDALRAAVERGVTIDERLRLVVREELALLVRGAAEPARVGR